jgi:hypothetical protein
VWLKQRSDGAAAAVETGARRVTLTFAAANDIFDERGGKRDAPSDLTIWFGLLAWRSGS